MITTKYPNRDALYAGYTIYRDPMRRFIIRCLKKHPDAKPEELISKVLTRKSDKPDEPIILSNEIEATEAIDIGDFPDMVTEYWKDVVSFSEEFEADSTVRTDMETIRQGRKLWAHPKLEDVDPGKTQTLLSLISKVLGEINEPNEKRKIEAIRNQLFPYDSESNLEKVRGELTTLKKQQEATDKRLVTIEEYCTNIAYTLNQLTALKPINSTEHSINEQNQLVEAEEDSTYEEATISTPSLEPSSLQKNAEVSSTLKVGQTLTAKVERINTTAVFVALGEVKGFIPPSELTLKRANHPSDVVSVDEEVEVIVTDLKAENDGKLPVLRLRSKHNEWIHRVGEKEYRKDSEVEVTITRIHPDHGAFVELEEGISGLIYQSTIPPNIFDQLQEDQKIPAIISHVDLENEKISLRLYDRWNSPSKLDKISSPSHTQTAVGYGT